MSGAEVIERDTQAELLELVQGAGAVLRVLHGAALGDLQLQEFGWELRLHEHPANTLNQVELLELRDREVDRKRDRIETAVVPGLGLHACRAQHPESYRRHHACVLRKGNEIGRRNQTQLGVLPSQQRLEPGNLQAAQIDDRLVVDHQLIVEQRAPQAVLEGDPQQSLGIYNGVEELVVVSSFSLCLIHGRVGILDERLGLLAVFGVEADSDAGGDEELATFHGKGMLYGLEDLLGHARGILGMGELRQQKCELVAAEAGHGVAFADTALNPPGHSLQQLISRRVAEGIVDDLKAIEVQEEDRQPLVSSLGVGESDGQPVLEEKAIGQTGQGVVVSQVLDLFFGVGPLGHIANNADHPAAVDGRYGDLLREEHPIVAPAVGFPFEQ